MTPTLLAYLPELSDVLGIRDLLLVDFSDDCYRERAIAYLYQLA